MAAMTDRCACCETELSEPLSRETGVCDLCRDKLGIVAMGVARRPPTPCQRCNGLAFVRAIPREHAGTHVSEAAPMVVTHEPGIDRGWLGTTTRPVLHTVRGIGRLELYICRGCGFVEWYVDAPQDIPIGPQYMTELVDYGSKKPYR